MPLSLFFSFSLSGGDEGIIGHRFGSRVFLENIRSGGAVLWRELRSAANIIFILPSESNCLSFL